jgi:hypothetical protein
VLLYVDITYLVGDYGSLDREFKQIHVEKTSKFLVSTRGVSR